MPERFPIGWAVQIGICALAATASISLLLFAGRLRRRGENS